MTDRKDWSDKEELINELLKGEEIYRTDEGRMVATGHIIKNYLRIKGIKSNPKTIESTAAPIVDMVLNDKEFRYFTFDNYKVYITYDNKDEKLYIHKITDEMLELIEDKNFNPDDERHQDRLFDLEDELYGIERNEDAKKK